MGWLLNQTLLSQMVHEGLRPPTFLTHCSLLQISQAL